MPEHRASDRRHSEQTLRLRDIAEQARRASSPIRAWRDEGERFVEVYFYRDFIIHADFRGTEGLRAAEEMMHREELEYRVDVGVWPRRHTMLADWKSLGGSKHGWHA